MAVYDTSEFRPGLKVMIDGDPCSIMENEFVKPGKGQAFNRVRLRNLKNGRVLEKTIKSGFTVEAADVAESAMQYLYAEGGFWHFMKTDGSFEQYGVDKVGLGDATDWLKEEEIYSVILWNNKPLNISPPNTMELEVVETEPGVKGDTVSGGQKPAKLSSGVVIRVPLFVNEGDKVKVDTRDKTYLSRA